MRSKQFLLYSLVVLISLMVWYGCGPKPPIDYQTLQIQDSEESRGYDIYLYIAVPKETKDEDIEKLLKWFDEVKYPQVKTMRVFVWDNPQAALMSAMGDLVGSLYVDRTKGIFEITVRGKRL